MSGRVDQKVKPAGLLVKRKPLVGIRQVPSLTVSQKLVLTCDDLGQCQQLEDEMEPARSHLKMIVCD